MIDSDVTPDVNIKPIWLASERHRRSRELSQFFGAELFELLDSDNQIPNRIIRYAFIFFKASLILLTKRPKLLFVQNPSIFLTAMICFLSNLFRYSILVDRHSNFKLSYTGTKKLKWYLFKLVSDYTLKKARITIVTNLFLAEIVEKKGGVPFVLEDKLPTLSEANSIELEGKYSIVVISTFSNDEPIEALIGAALELPEDWMIFFTGCAEKYIDPDRKKKLERRNIRFLGFVPENTYQSLIKSADLVAVLTTEEYLLNCGAYEAVSLEKALIVSDTETMKRYFRKGVVYTAPYSENILKSIIYGIENRERLQKEAAELKVELSEEWRENAQVLIGLINSMMQR